MFQWLSNQKIKSKLLVSVGFVLAIFLIANAFVLNQVINIGEELNDVSDYDINVIKNLSSATIHQLEQGIYLERPVRQRYEVDIIGQAYISTIARFEAMGEKVTKELKTTENLVKKGIDAAHSDIQLKEFEKILAQLIDIEHAHDEYMEHAREYITYLKSGQHREHYELLEQIEKEEDHLDNELKALLKEIDDFTAESLKLATEHEHSIVYLMVVAFVMAALFSGVLFNWLGGAISSALNTSINAANSLAKGNFDVDLTAKTTDESGDMIRALKAMKEKVFLRMKQESEEAFRIKRALDVCNTNVMMADSDMNIIYMNSSIEGMFSTAEADLKKDLPRFDANKLMGENVDVFHKNPSHQRDMIAKLKDSYRSQIVVGGRTFSLIATPVFSDDNERMGTVVEWEDRTEELAKIAAEKQVAAENYRIKQALDNVSANVMMADADRNIIYMNDAVTNTLRNAQEDLRKDLPNFNVDQLLGTSIDGFHKNPQHQITMLENLRATHNASIVVGGRTMSLIVSPVTNEEGERLGTVVEWADRTAEVAIEKEIDVLVEAAANGNLSGRVDLMGKSGFFSRLGEGLNSMLGSAEGILTEVGSVLSAMSQGDLQKSVSGSYEGAFAQIQQDTNATLQRLNEVIGKIRDSAQTVNTAANEIAQGNTDLSQRTEEQASSLEETASSMEEMTSTVKQSSDSAADANRLASDARKIAQDGGHVVDQAVSAMSEILKSSKKINDIIGVIDEIAFQTNLLALNAAVEAARAGEQGRGFAVVAGEVRNLSQRSAAAAKEIKDLIKESVAKVEAGSSLVNESGQTLNAIVNSVEQVANSVSDIANASYEQTSGIDQINTAVAQMDEMTQQNAALVEQASAASEAMSEQAQSMSRQVAFFQLGGSDVVASAEPIMSYQSSGPAQSAPAAGGSDDDEWEDF